MVRVMAMVVGGLFLFTAGLLGTLGARGKLNSQTLNEFLGKEAPGGDVEPGQTASDDGADDADSEDDAATAASEHVASTKHAVESRISSAVAASPIIIEAPFSDEETARLFDELRGARSEAIDARAQLERERQDLELVRLDLNRRWDEVELREQELEEYSNSLVAERVEIDQRAVLLKEAEVDNLQKLARNVEKMSSDGAAKMLMEKTPDRTALILRYVKPRETGKILDAMGKEYASQVAERMLGVLESDSTDPNGGE